MSNVVAFILGVVSSIVAAPILFILRYNFSFFVNLIFYKVFPDVSGEYDYYFYNTVNVIGLENKKKNQNNKTQDKITFDKDLTNLELLKWLKKRNSKRKNNTHYILKLKQFAHMISGELIAITNSEIQEMEKISGKITASRVLILNWESIDHEHHNLGTYLLNLTNDLSMIKGTASGLCANCGDATSAYVFLEKRSK